MRKIFLFALMAIFANAAIAQSRLKPINQTEQQLWGKNNFSKLFDDDNCLDMEQFLVFPSFFKPSALYIYSGGKNKGQLVVKYKDDTYKMTTNDFTVKKLKSLYKHSINVAMYPFDRMGFDGTQYFFFDERNGATCWTPVDNCERLINVMKNIMNAVKANSQEEIDKQMPARDSLITIFKGLYPSECFEPHVWVSSSNVSTRVSMQYGLCDVVFNFEYPKTEYTEGMDEVVYDKYNAIVMSACRDLFVNTSAFDEQVYIELTVDNNKPRDVNTIKYGHPYFTLHEDDITEENLKKIFLDWHQSLSNTNE